jgi:hypothetical protein
MHIVFILWISFERFQMCLRLLGSASIQPRTGFGNPEDQMIVSITWRMSCRCSRSCRLHFQIVHGGYGMENPAAQSALRRAFQLAAQISSGLFSQLLSRQCSAFSLRIAHLALRYYTNEFPADRAFTRRWTIVIFATYSQHRAAVKNDSHPYAV